MKRALIAVLMILCLSIFVEATDDIEFANDSISLTGASGTLSSSFIINNIGDTFLNATFSSYTLTCNDYKFNISNINNINNIENGTMRTVSLNVPIPAYQAPCAYTGNLIVNGGTDSDTMQVTVEVPTVNNMEVPSSVSFGKTGPGMNSSTTFTITNVGNTNISNLNLSSNLVSAYNFHIEPGQISVLTPGASQSVKVNITVPNNEQTGNRSVGTLFLRSDNYNSSISINIDVVEKLIIQDLDVEVDDQTSSGLGDGATIGDSAEPENDVTFYFKIKNDFTRTENIDINDVTITVTIDNIDLGDSLEEESDQFDLDQGESKSVELKFKVPLKVNEDTYPVKIEVTGEDDKRVNHKIVWDLELKVDKKSHDVRIMKALLEKSTVDCERSNMLDIEIMNVGSNSEDQVTLEVKNAELGINFIENDISLDNDPESDENEYAKSIPISVGADARAKTYPLTVKLYYSDDVLDDIKTVNMIVRSCVQTPVVVDKPVVNKTVEEKEDVVVTPKKNDSEIIVPILTEKVTETKESSFKDTPAYMALLIGAIIIAVLFIALVMIKVLFIGKE